MPSIILSDEKLLKIRCRPALAHRIAHMPVWIELPIRELEKVWVGKPNDFPTGLLMNTFESKSYPDMRTLLLWKKANPDPFVHRDFGMLRNADELLSVLRAE